MTISAPEVTAPAPPAPVAEAVVADLAPAVAALPAVPLPVALPAVAPAAVRHLLADPATVRDTHMAELCAARPVFCQVDSSGHYIAS